MDRDVVGAVLVGILCGPLLLAGGGFPRLATRSRDDLCAWERRAWRSLWVPTLPAWLALGFVVGWLVQEPSLSDEPVSRVGALVAIGFALLWSRALLRACWSAARRPRTTTAATVGLLSPRIEIADSLRAALDDDALAAALAHEEAHRRARDPLRILVAQLLADLQWPWPAAKARLSRWRESLELLRDDDARRAGADGADLAAALLVASKLANGCAACAIEGAAGAALSERVQRLLLPARERRSSSIGFIAPFAAAAAAAALAVGYELGDSVVRALLGFAA